MACGGFTTEQWTTATRAVAKLKLGSGKRSLPFDGKPLRFKEIGKIIVIYSIGENKVDDGGDVDMERQVSPDLGFLVHA